MCMTTTIVGAGAIGGTIGAYLARAGEEVLLVDQDRAHVDEMRAHGLTIQGFAETFTVQVRACMPGELAGALGTILLAVKSQHTAAAVQTLIPLLTQESAIVSLQNGLCERIIAGLVGQ